MILDVLINSVVTIGGVAGAVAIIIGLEKLKETNARKGYYTAAQPRSNQMPDKLEPLAEGQWRWALFDKDGEWEVVNIRTYWNDPNMWAVWRNGCEVEEIVDSVYAWGNVIPAGGATCDS